MRLPLQGIDVRAIMRHWSSPDDRMTDVLVSKEVLPVATNDPESMRSGWWRGLTVGAAAIR